MRCTAASFLCLFVFIRFSEVYTYDHSISEEFLKTHNFFQRYLELSSWFARLFYIFIVGFVNRCKFHSAWKLSEGIYNYVGVGYMGITSSGKHAWNRMQNVNIHRVEWPENPRMVSVNWNIYTQKWLRNHVYLRFSNGRGDDSGWITLITFITSAFWHGFHPGYYVSFGILGFSVVAARLIRRYVRPLFIDTWLSTFKVVYDVAGVFATMLVVNFAQIPFQMLVIEKVLKSWASLYYLLPVFLGIILIGFQWLNWGLVLRRYHRSHSFNPVASSNPKLD
jgi:lysophospholipid acyltransferase